MIRALTRSGGRVTALLERSLGSSAAAGPVAAAEAVARRRDAPAEVSGRPWSRRVATSPPPPPFTDGVDTDAQRDPEGSPSDGNPSLAGTLLDPARPATAGWALRRARALSRRDPLNPWAQPPERAGGPNSSHPPLDPRLAWRVALPGQVAAAAASAADGPGSLADDMRRLGKILATKKRSDRRQALRRFLSERRLVEPAPLDPSSAGGGGTGAAATRPRGARVAVVGWNRSGHMTTGGRVDTLGVMVLVGDGLNSVGVGYGQAAGAPGALARAYRRALASTVKVPKYFRHTIRNPAEARVGATVVKLWPAASGRGHRCGAVARSMADLCGLRDLRGRVMRRRHTFNAAKAFHQCLRRGVARSHSPSLRDSSICPYVDPALHPSIQSVYPSIRPPQGSVPLI